MSHEYKRLLKQFAEHVGLSPVEKFLQTEEIIIDETTVSFIHESNADIDDILFFTLLNAPEPDKADHVHELLLQANYLWAGTGGLTLGLHPEDGRVMCCGRAAINALSAKSLAALLNRFVDTAVGFQEIISRGGLLDDKAARPRGGQAQRRPNLEPPKK